MSSGIYKITNKVNFKFYIGSAKDLRVRKNLHFSKLNLNEHENQYLQNSWNKYGKDNFKFEIIELVEDKTKLIEREQYWLDMYDACNRGYNLCEVAGSRLGAKHTEETKKLISQIQIGKSVSIETKALLLFYSSQPKSNDTKKKISNSLKGKAHTEQRRINILNSFYGPLILTQPPVILGLKIETQNEKDVVRE